MENKKFTIVGVGEILWDMLPGGKKLGGAPANFAYHAGELGCEAYIISSVGNDKLGKEIIETLDVLGVSSRYIQVDDIHPTGTVEVQLKGDGIPSYIIHEDVAWDYICLDESYLELAEKADAICFGSLGQRSETSRNTILQVLSNTGNHCIKVFDINIRQHFYNKEIIHNSLKHANVFKLNENELPIVSNLLGFGGPDIEILQQLGKEYSLKLIALTRGEKGSILLSDNHISTHPGFPVKVVDTVGAGDAFTAAVVVGMIRNWDIDSINNFANRVGSYVCTQEGGTPKLPEALKELSMFQRL
ncbi:MAG: carbohydrate kinase [Firmicutes bacterium]|nr:carbohydrate kinase [Bacillota bacterium]